MSHYILEFALWIILAFAVGCVIGWLLRTWFGAEEVAAPRIEAPQMPEPERINPSEPAVLATVEPMDKVPDVSQAAEAAAATVRMERPKGLTEARAGKPDDLRRISGIGPKNEKILHTLGFFHFDQIAEWTVEQVAWVDDHLKFNGRIGREEWIAQARLLADGKEDEFRSRYGSGGKKTEDGKTVSGSRTRKS